MFQLVLCTCPNDAVAQQIARALVSEKLAACVNIIQGVQSVYRWQDEVQCEPELQLLIKTTAEKYSALQERIIALHPYEVPEVIALDIQRGHSHYLDWINQSMK